MGLRRWIVEFFAKPHKGSAIRQAEGKKPSLLGLAYDPEKVTAIMKTAVGKALKEASVRRIAITEVDTMKAISESKRTGNRSVSGVSRRTIEGVPVVTHYKTRIERTRKPKKEG